MFSNLQKIPIAIKNGVWNKPILLCQSDDPHLNFDGDTGAVGRIYVTEENLTFDLKGRQYKGGLRAGPTVMVLNMAPPVGGQSNNVQSARVEYITNEYCQLDFEKDLLSDLKGIYTG